MNILVANGRLVVAEPFYDDFKTEFVSRLSAVGYQNGSSLRFIDDWEVYHRFKGEVHCGTQVRRAPSSVTWWVHVPD